MFRMLKSFRPRRHSAAAFAGLALASFAAAPGAFAQEDTGPQTVRVATGDQVLSTRAAPAADAPAPDPCAVLTFDALRMARGCNGATSIIPDYSLQPATLYSIPLDAEPTFQTRLTDSDTALLLAPNSIQPPRTDYNSFPRDTSDDVVIVIGQRPPERDLSAAYYADLDRRFGGNSFNDQYRNFEDWLGSGVGRTVTALGLGILADKAADAALDEVQDFLTSGMDTRGDFSMDPMRASNDAWMRETFLRQRGINPDDARRPR